jgi:hypothetical protein
MRLPKNQIRKFYPVQMAPKSATSLKCAAVVLNPSLPTNLAVKVTASVGAHMMMMLKFGCDGVAAAFCGTACIGNSSDDGFHVQLSRTSSNGRAGSCKKTAPSSWSTMAFVSSALFVTSSNSSLLTAPIHSLIFLRAQDRLPLVEEHTFSSSMYQSCFVNASQSGALTHLPWRSSSKDFKCPSCARKADHRLTNAMVGSTMSNVYFAGCSWEIRTALMCAYNNNNWTLCIEEKTCSIEALVFFIVWILETEDKKWETGECVMCATTPLFDNKHH